MKKRYSIFLLSIFTLLMACGEDPVEADVKQVEVSDDPLDQYIRENFLDNYGVAVRYRYVDRYVNPVNRVTPPRKELVQPTLEFLNKFWIDPFLQVANGEEFFRSTVPAEVVLIGSFIFNTDGTVVLGTADAGARITLTDINSVDEEDQDWVFRQLGTIYHEYAHIMHQRFNLPPNFQQISPQGYTSAGSWFTLTDDEALRRGFVSPYSTSSFNEDFAEIVAFVLYDPDFYANYIDQEANCTDAACIERNEGRDLIRRKYNAVIDHYQQNTGVDLLKVREIIQARL
ncbi:substrate import-associated zinc metallohydrolase lipoprotein [Catalinimonas niigatensis]|uniref:substrate import-associated zinc metallohydrolase lipoprotein n=1 Tax=Catalinimonas niigatensis TaxID=1397264 RepID=UPI0026667125|nr:substrate import-associated zinc metallohydrolase lipoprotein [Catalinimonas niigatensis]WPP49545.1 substrate import-associated zinc metallohydrolase lipoprotein [Catalinimonas niigatensis]